MSRKSKQTIKEAQEAELLGEVHRIGQEMADLKMEIHTLKTILKGNARELHQRLREV